MKSLLDRLCEVIAAEIAPGRIETARRRHAAVLAGREADYLPISFGVYRTIEGAEPFSFHWAEQWHDPAKSLATQLVGVLAAIRGGADAVPGVRADTGVINCMTVFGARYVVPEHTKPVICQYVSKEALRDFLAPADVSGLGVIPRMIEHMQHHLSVLREHGLDKLISVYHCDQQGPFDIAAQARGHEIFVDLYEDGDFVHELMEKSTQVYLAVTRLCKRINGEGDGPGNAVGVWMEKGAARMCGDSDILVGPRQYREFIQPYQQKAFDALGGGWLHYCGGWKGTGRCEGLHLHELYAKIAGLRGLNWTTAGDWLDEMRKLRMMGIVHIGSLPRGKDEPLAEYFRRALSPYDRRWGMIFEGPELREGEAEVALDLWHGVQDGTFGRRRPEASC